MPGTGSAIKEGREGSKHVGVFFPRTAVAFLLYLSENQAKPRRTGNETGSRLCVAGRIFNRKEMTRLCLLVGKVRT